MKRINESAKLKAVSQEEQINLWKEHFKNLLGKSLKVTDKPITENGYQHDIKLEHFTQGELFVILTKIKNRKAAHLDEKPIEVWQTRKFDDLLLRRI